MCLLQFFPPRKALSHSSVGTSTEKIRGLAIKKEEKGEKDLKGKYLRHHDQFRII